MITYFVMLIIMTMIGSVASLFLKKASAAHGFIILLTNLNLYIGGMLYFISALLNIYILRQLDYSIVLPLTSITYIWTMILSYLILKEKITIKKLVGVSLIIVGAIFVSI